ncbi:MAG TPA: FtsX-like permease family protein [Candidatus Acidoferrales bacterium]|jgi:putative ABC transport system permease protein|nr:FtsX-like permease family protein [Candidatus Acidoferrales bacterium]
MFKATLAGLLAHKLRLALTAFAIVLGVAFVSATLTLSNGLQTTFDNIFNTTPTGVAVVVRGHVEPGGQNGGFGDAHRPVPDSLLAGVQQVDGVTAAEGVVFRAGASLLDKTGKPYASGGGPPEFATNWIESQALSPYRIRSGSPPTQATDVVIDAATASAHGITVGQRIQYVINGGAVQTFTVSGIAGYGSSDSLAGATISLFRLDVAQQQLGLQGKFDQIDAASSQGLSQSDLRDRIARHLPSYAEAATEADAIGQQVKGIDSFFGILRTILLVFALIALFVGSYIIINTFSILIAQRTRELALLRALGATRGQVFRMVLSEALLTGIVASAIGVVAGLFLAHGLYSLVSSVGNGLPNADLVLQPSTVIIGMVLGTVITLVASILPARKASRVSPVAAIRDASDAAQPLGRGRIIAGVTVSLLGVIGIALGLFAGTSVAFQLLGLGALLLYLGVSSLAPLTVVPIVGLLGMPIARFRGAPGKLARTNAIRAPRRAASTAAALMIGVSLVVGIAVLTESAKASTQVALQQAVKADYMVFPGGASGQGAISPMTTATLARDPHFSNVDDLKQGTILIGGASTSVFSANPADYEDFFTLDVASGDPNSLGQGNTIFLDETEASNHGWHVGDAIDVTFPQTGATVKERIGCIFNPNAITTGYMISSQQYAVSFPEAQTFIILLRAAPGVSHTAGLAALNKDLTAFPTLTAYDQASFLALQSQSLDQLTQAIDIFLIMAIVIAALGIVNTLALSIIERTRELGLLRAIGLTRRQTRTMVRWESVLMAFLGLILGVVIGVALGVAVVRALAFTGLGHIAVPFVSLLGYAVGAFVIGLLAAILPARRAARLNVLEAISTE